MLTAHLDCKFITPSFRVSEFPSIAHTHMRITKMKTRSQQRVAHLTDAAEDIITLILSKSVSHVCMWGCVPDPPPLLHEVCKRFRDIFRKNAIWKLICQNLGIAKNSIDNKSYKFAYFTSMLHELKANNICSDENEIGKAYRSCELKIQYAGCMAEYGRLFEHVTQISSLTTLDMSYCKDVYSLPPSISILQNLKELNLNGCDYLDDVTPVVNLKSLQVLRMNSRFNANSLPAQIGNLKRLKVLQISCWTKLSALPSCVCNLSSLTQLDMNFCYSLQKLPKAMYRMKSLKHLAMINVGRIRSSKEQLHVLKGISSLVNINYQSVAKFFKAVNLYHY